MNHELALKLGKALGNLELVVVTLEHLNGYTLTKEKVDNILTQIKRAQDYILEAAGSIHDD